MAACHAGLQVATSYAPSIPLQSSIHSFFANSAVDACRRNPQLVGRAPASEVRKRVWIGWNGRHLNATKFGEVPLQTGPYIASRQAQVARGLSAIPKRSEQTAEIAAKGSDEEGGYEEDVDDAVEWYEGDDDGDEDDVEEYVEVESEDAGSQADFSGLKAEGNEDDYLRIGVITGPHGLRGELKVRSFTDFPEQRFKQPGLRWLKRPGIRKQALEPVHLVRGRIGPGRPSSWLLHLKGVTSIEQAEQLVGSSLMVAPEDRPTLDEGDFYSPDLIGMGVLLQETGETLGVIEDIATAGAGELLRVRLTNTLSPPGATANGSASTDFKDQSEGRLIWVPFDEQIVPVVDCSRRIIEITPPEGLLDIGAPSEAKLLRQKRNVELGKQRRLKRKVALARKRYTAAGQVHALAGLKEGEPEQQMALVEQLLRIDLRELDACLREALPGASASGQDPPTRQVSPPPSFPGADWDALRAWLTSAELRPLQWHASPVTAGDQGLDENPPAEPAPLSNPEADLADSAADGVDVVQESQKPRTSEKKSLTQMRRWWKNGLQLVAGGKVATLVLAGGQGTRLGQNAPPAKGMLDIGLPGRKSLFELQAERLRKIQDFANQAHSGNGARIPWLVMTSDATDEATRAFFEEHGHFGLDSSQVTFVKQPSLPCVSVKAAENGKHLLLLSEPHQVAESPGGNGAVFEVLHKSGALEKLKGSGVELLQVYAVDNALVKVADPIFYGYCHERRAEVGIKTVARTDPDEAVGLLCLRSILASENLGQSEVRNADWESGSGGAVGSDSIPEGSGSSAELVGGRDEKFYAVIEYSEMDDVMRHAIVESKRSGQSGALEKPEDDEPLAKNERNGNKNSQLLYRAAHICVNMFSVGYLEKLATNEKLRLPYHGARKRIPHVENVAPGEWRNVSPESVNGIKLERFIFDAFRYADPYKVAILEVDRAEEFAPVKNASGPGVVDTPDTAREQLLALDRRNAEARSIF